MSNETDAVDLDQLPEALTGDELVLAQLTTTSATSPTNSGLPAARMRGMDGRHLTNVV